jgi:hypothetical protein
MKLIKIKSYLKSLKLNIKLKINSYLKFNMNYIILFKELTLNKTSENSKMMLML